MVIPRPANKTIIAKTSVISATFDPKSIPRPNDGTPSMAEVMEINPSGKIEIIETMMNPTVYFDNP